MMGAAAGYFSPSPFQTTGTTFRKASRFGSVTCDHHLC